MKKILISSFDMEIGGVERSLISMLENFDYENYNVDLMLYSHSGDLMKLLPNKPNLLSENKKYIGALNMTKTRWNQRKTHRFYRCPKCKTWLRVPKNRGKITITCVKCSHKFDKRT